MVEHDFKKQRFQYEQNEAPAVLKYKILIDPKSGQHTVDFYSTFVPESLRGKGIAEKLVRTGLKWANEQNHEITASCWYVEKFLRKKK
ncbi:GNAT family N-acetyltransferase [Marinomonas sp. 15G1-11]|uniref:GNAT family N-acetyltransferase n=1 Tax=Marinomonas phaeophyticola TaxID=3004091 RepID=A0ABT4JT53_9GAMM|nr:GNAT family N-acetyltransferase [Marinomonas sp. 15G1-11]MCZ2721505.1 GNAT family N-acetyltransferase [Marinomonas sp. 15G1-11]